MGAALAYYLIVRPLSMLPLFILYRFSDLFYLLLISVFPTEKQSLMKTSVAPSRK
jgi:Kdo2-lipid IVA lauroyltransferase/acyltransferase